VKAATDAEANAGREMCVSRRSFPPDQKLVRGVNYFTSPCIRSQARRNIIDKTCAARTISLELRGDLERTVFEGVCKYSHGLHFSADL